MILPAAKYSGASLDGRVIIIMGVSGCGKSTVGRSLAGQLGYSFADADDFHSPANKAKMQAGYPLSDEDRAQWLTKLQELIAAWLKEGHRVVLACSALKEKYRQILRSPAQFFPPGPVSPITFVYLQGSFHLIAGRLKTRENHFMNPALLASQFSALEEPGSDEALIFEIDKNPEELADQIKAKLPK